MAVERKEEEEEEEEEEDGIIEMKASSNKANGKNRSIASLKPLLRLDLNRKYFDLLKMFRPSYII